MSFYLCLRRDGRLLCVELWRGARNKTFVLREERREADPLNTMYRERWSEIKEKKNKGRERNRERDEKEKKRRIEEMKGENESKK